MKGGKRWTKTLAYFRHGHNPTTKWAVIYFQHIFLQVIYLQKNGFDVKKYVGSKFQKLLMNFYQLLTEFNK